MTLRQLHTRLGNIIAENEKRGRDCQNDQPVILRFIRGRNTWWIPITSALGGGIRLQDGILYNELWGREEETIKTGQRK